MITDHKKTMLIGSNIDPYYSSGNYFSDPRRHSSDAIFKVKNFLKIFLQFAEQNNFKIKSYVDVGCGSGDIVKQVADSLNMNGFDIATVKGYDVSPHVQNIQNESVEYIYGDFCETDEYVDLVTLFDVIEHVPDMIGFIKKIAQMSKLIGFHIPLDNSLNNAIRNKFNAKLKNPGHLIFMDCASALNILAFSGLRVVNYEFTFEIFTPSGRKTIFQKIAFPFRCLLANISPWLLSKTLGGANIIVLAVTEKGLQEMQKKM